LPKKLRQKASPKSFAKKLRQKASPKSFAKKLRQKASEEAQKAFERDVDLLDRERDVDSGMAALEEAVNIFPDYKEDYFEQSLTKVRTVFDKRLHIGRH
jgi:hypothetical protein